MKPQTGLAIAIAVMVVIGLGDRVIGARVGLPEDVVPLAKDLSNLPIELGDWTGTTRERDPDMDDAVGAEKIVNRVYKRPDGTTVAVHAATWSDYNGLPHRPQECHIGAGFDIKQETDIVDDSDPQGAFAARLLEVSRNGHKMFVLYWYLLGDTVVRDNYELKAAHRHLRGKPTRPQLVKIMLSSGAAQEQRVQEKLTDLATRIGNWLAEEK